MPVYYRRPLWPPGWRWWEQWSPPRWGTRTGWWSRPPGWNPRRSAPSLRAAHCHWPDLRSLGPGHREWRGPTRISTGQSEKWLYLRARDSPIIYRTDQDLILYLSETEARSLWTSETRNQKKNLIKPQKRETGAIQYRLMVLWGERPKQDNDNKWIY